MLRETITLAARGDAQARRALIERFYPTVSRLVHQQLAQSFRQHHRWIGPLFSTGDIVHDVLAEVITGLDAFAGDGEGEFTSYLATAVSHRLIDAVRHHQAQCRDARRNEPATLSDRLSAACDEAGAPDSAAIGEQMAIFERQLAAMPLADRELIELRLTDSLPFADIAVRLGFASDNSARKAFDRAHARLLLKLRAAGLRAQGDEP